MRSDEAERKRKAKERREKRRSGRTEAISADDILSGGLDAPTEDPDDRRRARSRRRLARTIEQRLERARERGEDAELIRRPGP